MSMPDAAIAAIAAANGCTFATRNAADFATTGLHVINPWAGEAAGTR
jgi:predicted nucleic acid-binding protein